MHNIVAPFSHRSNEIMRIIITCDYTFFAEPSAVMVVFKIMGYWYMQTAAIILQMMQMEMST